MKFKFDFKRTASAALSLALVLSVLILPKTVSADTAQSGNLIVNGDFEAGNLTGFEIASGSKIEVVNAKKNAADTTTFTGYAAYMPGGAADTANTLLQAVKLNAGTYTWSFDVDLKIKNGGWNFLFGVYTGLKGGVGYGSGKSIGTATGINKAGGALSSNALKANGANGFYLTFGKATSLNATISIEFTLSEETTVYFDIRTAATAYSYIDNMTLTAKTELSKVLVNGDFESGTDGWSVTEGTNAATFKTVDAVQNSNHKDIKITNNAGYFVTGGTDTWLYQGVKLAAGEYTWSFHLDLYGTHNMVGAYKSKSGIGTAASLITADTFTAVNDAGKTSTAFKKETNDYRIGLGLGNSHYTVTYVFTLTEETEVYFAIRGNGGGCQYIDNMTLVKALGKELVNGNFESGTDGWSVTEGTNAATFKTVDKAQNDNHKNINITDNAGYFVTGGTDTWLYQGVKLAAGEYTWSFHLDLYGTHNMVGAYKSKSGIGTAASLITADTFTAVNDSGKTSTAFKKETNDYRIGLGLGNSHYTVTYVFTLTEETEVYFAIRGNGGGCQYIDNMTLKAPQAPAATSSNYDFEDGKTDKIAFVESTEGLSSTTSVSEEYAHSGTKSLKSVAVADNDNTASSGNYQGGRFALPISVEKNKFYKTTFWLRIDGDKEDDGVAFRISKTKNVAAQAHSIISSNSGPNPSAEFTLNPANTEWTMKTVYNSGWAGFIKIMNTNTASTGDWVEVSVKFASNDSEEVYLEFANFFRKGTVFYLDDVVTEEITSVADDSLSYDFETGGTGELKYGAGDSNSLSSTTKLTAEEKHGGSQSLVSTAVADSTVNGSAYQGGTVAVPLKNLEKNKNYRLSFWLKIKGDDASDMIAFRVASDIPATYRNSIISSNTEIFYATNLTVSDSSYKPSLISKPASGWAGYIGISNTNKGSAWIKISVDFCAGENDNVYLQFANFFKTGTTFYLDDIEYSEIDSLRVPPVAEYDDENIVYYITFEEDESVPMNANGTPATHYSKTTEYAHSGKYSVKWDSNHNDGWNYLYYTDKVGNMCYDPVLEPSTAYRFSLWVYSVGPKFASTSLAYQYPGMQQTSVKTQAGKWEQIVIDFVTEEDQTSFPFKICSAFMRFGDTYQYIDDIKLEKLTCSITAVDTADNYCEEFFNKVKNGNFENELKNTVWDTSALNIKRVKATESNASHKGAYYGKLTGNASYTVKLNLKSVYQYKFMYSYRTSSASSLKIGILDDEGNELKLMSGVEGNISGLLSPTVADGEWHRAGYTFLTPASGVVYLKIEGTNLNIDLDEIAVYMSRITYEEDPNTYKDMVKKTDDSEASVPDTVVDTDIDIDTDIDLDTEIPSDDGEKTDNKGNSQSTNKANTPEKETNGYLWIILIAGLAVALAAGAAVCIIIIKKRSKKQ